MLSAPEQDKSKLVRAEKEAKTLFEKRLSLFERGILDGKDGEEKLVEAKTQLRKAQEKLHSLDASSDAVSFDPATPKQYIRAIQGLVASMVDPAEKPDAKALGTIRSLVSEIVVSPVENDAISVEVKGRVSAFVSTQEPKVGGLVVAEEGLEPPTRGL